MRVHRSPVTGSSAAVIAAVLGSVVVAACAGKPLPIPTPPPGAIGPSVAAPSPSASPAATPDGSSGGQASPADAFRSAVADGLSYTVKVDGDVLLTVSDLAVTGTLSASGADVASSMKYTFDYGEKDTIDTRLVGGKQWVRVNGGAWKAKKVAPASVVQPFAGALSAGAITDNGPKKVGGKSLHELRLQGGRLLDLTTIPAVNLTEERVTSGILTIDVDDAGRPVVGHWTQRGQGRVSGQLQEVDVDVDLTFSNVGRKVSISAP